MKMNLQCSFRLLTWLLISVAASTLALEDDDPLRPYTITAAIHTSNVRKCWTVFGLIDDGNTAWKIGYCNKERTPRLKDTGIATDHLPLALFGSELEIFYIGADTKLWKRLKDGVETSYGGLGVERIDDGTRAIGPETNVLSVTDGHLEYLNWANGTNWDGFVDLGDGFSTPAAIARRATQVEILAIDRSAHLVHKFQDIKKNNWLPPGPAWITLSGMFYHGGVFTTSYPGEAVPEVVHAWTLSNNELIHVNLKTGALENLGGSFTTVPRAVHMTSSRIDVVGQDRKTHEYVYKIFQDGTWTDDWASFGASFPAPPAVSVWEGHSAFAFGVSSTGKLLMKQWSVNDPVPDDSPFASLGNVFDLAPDASSAAAADELR